MTTTMIKAGNRTIRVDDYGTVGEFRNRILSDEAAMAMDLILASVNSDKPAGAVVERAFDIARLTFQHIKENRMDVPFPFAKAFPKE